MPKLPDYSSQNKAFLMYSAGIKPADIAKELGVTPNTITSWKKEGAWDDKIARDGSLTEEVIAVTKELPIDNSTINEVLRDKIIQAIQVDNIKPRKWKDVLDTLAFLYKGSPKQDAITSKSSIKQVEDMPDSDLDKEIQALSSLISVEKEEAEIIVYKNGAIKTE